MNTTSEQTPYVPLEANLDQEAFCAHPEPARWLVYWVMSRAVDRFGGRDDLQFNTACFQREWRDQMGVGSWLHAHEVQDILRRQQCAERLSGGAHWRMLPWKPLVGPSVFERPRPGAIARAKDTFR